METGIILTLILALAAVGLAIAALVISGRSDTTAVRVASSTYPQDISVVDGIELIDRDRVLVLDGDRAGIYEMHSGILRLCRTPADGNIVTIRDGIRYGNTYAVRVNDKFIPHTSTAPRTLRQRLADASRVPKVLHHVYGLWDTAPMPAEMQANREQWRTILNGWTLKLWNRADCERLMQQPGLVAMKDAWNAAKMRKCQQADLARYMILYAEGGWYVDLDAVPGVVDAPKMLPTEKSTILTETILSSDDAQRIANEQPIRHGVPEATQRIANYAMGFAPKDAFMRDVLRLASKRLLSSKAVENMSDYTVIYTTGPDVMSTVFESASSSGAAAPHCIDLEQSHELVCHRAAGGWRAGADR